MQDFRYHIKNIFTLSHYISIFVRTADCYTQKYKNSHTCTLMICRKARKWQSCQKHISVLFSGPGNNRSLKETMRRSITRTHFLLYPVNHHPPLPSPPPPLLLACHYSCPASFLSFVVTDRSFRAAEMAPPFIMYTIRCSFCCKNHAANMKL